MVRNDFRRIQQRNPAAHIIRARQILLDFRHNARQRHRQFRIPAKRFHRALNRGLRRQIAAHCIDKNSHGFLLLFRAHATEHLILPHKQRLLQVASGTRRIFSFIRHGGQAKSASVIPHTKW